MNPFSLFVPLFDWEDAEHLAGAIGALVDTGLSIWGAKRQRDADAEKADEDAKGLTVQTDAGDVPLGALLQEHNERLAKLEARARRPARRAKKGSK